MGTPPRRQGHEQEVVMWDSKTRTYTMTWVDVFTWPLAFVGLSFILGALASKIISLFGG
jgi:hypothetical protein